MRGSGTLKVRCTESTSTSEQPELTNREKNSHPDDRCNLGSIEAKLLTRRFDFRKKEKNATRQSA